jgi:hypothetical protein
MSNFNYEEINNIISKYLNEKQIIDDKSHKLMARKTSIQTIIDNNKDEVVKYHCDIINESLKKEEAELNNLIEENKLNLDILLTLKNDLKDYLKKHLDLLKKVNNAIIDIDCYITNGNKLDKDELATEIAGIIYANINQNTYYFNSRNLDYANLAIDAHNKDKYSVDNLQSSNEVNSYSYLDNKK